MLKVVEMAPRQGPGYRLWRCVCDCGGEIVLESRALKRGSIRDCGCRNLLPGQKDLKGERFGRLVALSSTGERKKGAGVYWNCQCDCGKKCRVPSGYLLDGTTRSCGCLATNPMRDLSGERFGHLTVLSYGGRIQGSHRWICRCDCGQVTHPIRQDYLLSGRQTSCGCKD